MERLKKAPYEGKISIIMSMAEKHGIIIPRNPDMYSQSILKIDENQAALYLPNGYIIRITPEKVEISHAIYEFTPASYL